MYVFADMKQLQDTLVSWKKRVRDTIVCVVVQSLSHVQLFAATWTAACQATLTFTVSQSVLRFMSIESVMSSKHLIVCCAHIILSQSFSAPGCFPMMQHFASGGQSIGASALASVLPMNIQGWFLLGLTGFISLLSKGLSKVLLQHKVQKHQFFGAQPALWSSFHICTWLLEKPQLWLHRPLWEK